MKLPYTLKPHLCRFSKFYPLDSSEIPSELFKAEAVKPDLSEFPLPLPSRKKDYSCSAQTEDGAFWYGASTGLTRYDPKAESKTDAVMYFSFERDLPDNNVKALLPKNGGIWVLTDKGAAFIELKMMTAAEKEKLLLDETLKIVDRRGMVSQRGLKVRGDISSALPYADSDNDGGFTANYAAGQVFKYATLKREKGIDDPETQAAKATAVRAIEACLLLFHIHGRGDGFVSRTYMLPDEPMPDDGIFFRRKGDKAYCCDTSAARKRGVVDFEVDASAPVPERLAKLYRDLGYTEEGIVYKGDTSSDETTLHFFNLYFAHELLGPDDPELDELIVSSAVGLMEHIIRNGFVLKDAFGKPTTWAKWNDEYFNSDYGWVDACLNAGELLMYLKITMALTGEEGKWKETYDALVAKGYADLTTRHFDRMYQGALSMCTDFQEEIMYGDHMLATTSLCVLCLLEKDPELLAKYRAAFKSWRSSIAKEFNPGYDFPYMVACPDEELDMERITVWFDRMNPSRLASAVSMVGRHDVAVRTLKAGYKLCSFVAPPDEHFIAKYDRDPVEYKNEDSGGAMCVEGCYVYTFAYWMGRYFGFIN